MALAPLSFGAQAMASEPPPASTPASTPAPALIPPRLIGQPTVPYPDGALGEATVRLTVTVNVDGTVRSAVPAEPNEPFSGAAARAATEWRYEPATRNGRAVASRIRVEVVFHPPKPPNETATESSTATATAHTTATASTTATAIQEVTVHGAHEEPSLTASLARAEVRQLPGAFGDPFRAIEVLPGVTPIISGLPYYYIRGAPPGDAGFFLDNIRVPYLFHVGLGPSIVHPALIDHVDLYPGGYPARFGRFAGGIVSGETVEPKDELHGEYNLRIFDAGAIAETTFDGGKGTVLLGGRYSFTALVLSLVAPNTLLSYWDYQGRTTYDLTPDDRVSVLAFGAYDYLGQKQTGEVTTVGPGGVETSMPLPPTTQTVFATQFHRIDIRDDHRLNEQGTMRVAITLGEDLTGVGIGQSVNDSLVGVRTEIVYRASPGAVVRAGADAEVDSYHVVFDPSMIGPSESALAANYFPSRTDLATGIRGDVVLDVMRGLEVTPGMRLDLYGSNGAAAIGFDPRLAARVAITGRTHLVWAMGIAHQPPAFIAPIPGIQPGGLKGGLQTAVQEGIGAEWDIDHATKATATLFHDGFFNFSDSLGVSQPEPSGTKVSAMAVPASMAVMAPMPMPTPSSPDGNSTIDSGSSQTIQSLEQRTNGTAYGLELYVKRKLTERFGGLISYTLSRSTRVYQDRDLLSAFDRTHVLTSAAAYDLGRSWRAGVRATYYTGLPKPSVPSSPSTRLPGFFRLDLRLEKRWQLRRHMWISFVAEWLNATLTKEAVPTSCTPEDCQTTTIGPVTIPSLGVEGGF